MSNETPQTKMNQATGVGIDGGVHGTLGVILASIFPEWSPELVVAVAVVVGSVIAFARRAYRDYMNKKG